MGTHGVVYVKKESRFGSNGGAVSAGRISSRLLTHAGSTSTSGASSSEDMGRMSSVAALITREQPCGAT
jgi:hypothetical protein